MRIRILGKDRAMIIDRPKVTLQFADGNDPDIRKKVLEMLIAHVTATDDWEDYDETSSLSVPSFHDRAG